MVPWDVRVVQSPKNRNKPRKSISSNNVSICKSQIGWNQVSADLALVRILHPSQMLYGNQSQFGKM